jgi:mannose-1-phosphate guanylyltransferase / mannose-6-phosphate isomerase
MFARAQRIIHPAILSGGVGSRLWPLSREQYPKQLLALTGAQTMIQQTVRRLGGAQRFGAPLVICNQEHRFIIAEQLREIGVTPRAIILEPEGRNTAPAAAVAALSTAERFGPEALVLLMPSDHLVADATAFRAAVDQAAAAAEAGALVTFGIKPTSPETGFGYIRAGAALEASAGARVVDKFVEKPDRATAQAYVADGGYSWNSGMFLFRAGDLIAEMERLDAASLDACRQALAAAKPDVEFVRLDAAAFQRASARSLDVAVMEQTRNAAVVATDMGWSDVGSWTALADIAPKDENGNTLIGDAVATDSRNCYVRSDGRLTALLGIDDAIVVATDDAVLVVAKDRAPDLKKLVDELRAAGREELVSPKRMYRPWGWHQTLELGERFRVKHIMVKPGQSLSLQKHYHRAEHWVVVFGVAEVTCGEEKRLVHENQSIFVPIGVLHRLHNPGKLPLKLIEVQSGSYLGEDDIVRLDDAYGRVKIPAG